MMRGAASVLAKIKLFPAGFAHASRLRFKPRVLRFAIEHNRIGCEKDLVPEPSTNQIREALEFSRFRFKLIEFLKLPVDIREPAFREVLERSCCGVYRNYLARAARVEKTLKCDDTLESEDTLEMNVLLPLGLDHHQSDPPNS
jgi:hypothetical protein